MVIMIVERIAPGLRGEMTRWMLEPKTGVFVGTLSAMVRDRLWERVCQKMGDGGAILIYNTDNEQGFAIKVEGNPSRCIVDFEGISLVRIPQLQT
ncbi:MAG: type I-E CRISPR-associated endoribonuclease Cas2e [Chloroflexi bacterium]|nr:type I-E CRISPR-associated endoribonuclease Cas2e [Chloroflexota bacterium]